MKDNYNNIDELLKQSLEGYKKEPSAGLWSKISVRLLLSGKAIYFILIPIALGILMVSFLSQKSDNTNVESVLESKDLTFSKADENATKEKFDNSNKTMDVVEIVDDSKHDEEIIPEPIQRNVLLVSPESNFTSDKKESSDLNLIPSVSNASVSPLPNQSHSMAYKYPGLESLGGITFIRSQAFSGFFLSQAKSQSINTRLSDYNIPSISSDDYGRPGMWSYGVHVVPEVIFNTNENSRNLALNFDVSGIYGIKDWFMQFGIGVGLSEDNGIYKIDYAQYDSIGYYYEVNGFEIDPSNGQPVFNTTTEGVYDTVLYNETQTTNNFYTYLRLPVYAGLKLHENKRFSVSLKAGGIYSVLLKKKEPDSDYTNDNATWIRITNDTPERIQNNFQLSIAIGLKYQLNNRLSVSAEPVYNYYLNSVYQQRYSSKSPWSLGLRAGIILQL